MSHKAAGDMRIVFWGTYDTGKPRIRILRAGLLAAGVQVQEIHCDLWKGIEDKSQVRGVGRWLWIGARWLLAFPHLIWALSRATKPDLVLVGYPGLLDVMFASAVCRWRKVPLVWDMFFSLYDTVVEDRRLFERRHLLSRILHRVERLAVRRPDLVFLDTDAHARRIESLFALPKGACGRVWVGAETENFAKNNESKTDAPPNRMQVLFYGQFIALHGIPTIIEAAHLLRDAPIDWILIGRGQEASRVRQMLKENSPASVRWIEWVPYLQLREWLQRADLCLGIFGTSEKAANVIPNKVFQIVAAGRPLVTRDSPAIRELFPDETRGVYLVPPGDAASLAAAIVQHHEAAFPSTKANWHAGVIYRISAVAVGVQFLEMLDHKRLTPCRAA